MSAALRTVMKVRRQSDMNKRLCMILERILWLFMCNQNIMQHKCAYFAWAGGQQTARDIVTLKRQDCCTLLDWHHHILYCASPHTWCAFMPVHHVLTPK